MVILGVSCFNSGVPGAAVVEPRRVLVDGMVDGCEGNKENGESENEREGLNDQVDGSDDVNDTLRGSPDSRVEVIDREDRGTDIVILVDVVELLDVTAIDSGGVATVSVSVLVTVKLELGAKIADIDLSVVVSVVSSLLRGR